MIVDFNRIAHDALQTLLQSAPTAADFPFANIMSFRPVAMAAPHAPDLYANRAYAIPGRFSTRIFYARPGPVPAPRPGACATVIKTSRDSYRVRLNKPLNNPGFTHVLSDVAECQNKTRPRRFARARLQKDTRRNQTFSSSIDLTSSSLETFRSVTLARPTGCDRSPSPRRSARGSPPALRVLLVIVPEHLFLAGKLRAPARQCRGPLPRRTP